MTVTILCPICRRAMHQVEGLDGVWRCPVHRTHEFYSSGAEKATEPKPPRQPEIVTDYAIVCPACGGVMRPVKGTAGAWRCERDEGHEFLVAPSAEQEAVGQEEPVGRTVQMELSAPYWLQHLGLSGPLPPVPQANITDGSACLLLGSVKRGGGNKSGRRRKKPKKGGQKYLDPWQ